MKVFSIAYLVVIIVCFDQHISSNKKLVAPLIVITSDTIPKFIVDDYPVTNEILGPNAHSRKSGEVIDGEGAWFTNDTLKQTLVFVLYTDYHRLVTYHFLNHDIPLGIIKRMELLTDNYDLAADKLKQKHFRGFIEQAAKIGRQYFVTNKKFRLGDSKDKALKVYGKPAKISVDEGIEQYEWDFTGDILYDGKEKLKRNILAKDSFGHQTTMFFRNSKLIGLIFHNDIP